MKQVVLVGLMGSGKSTVGALVATRTGRAFVDVDIVIAQETGKTVRELWEEGGEAAYRKLESEAVLRVLAGDAPSVLAAPGRRRARSERCVPRSPAHSSSGSGPDPRRWPVGSTPVIIARCWETSPPRPSP